MVAFYFIPKKYLFFLSFEIDLDAAHAFLFADKAKQTIDCFGVGYFQILFEILALLIIDEETGDVQKFWLAVFG